jgi:four helix bundle protein
MGRFRGDLPDRTFEFSVKIVELSDCLPQNNKGWVLGKQLLRSGTSVGANVCEANHALTDREFIQRCSIARKEAAETHYWLRLCLRLGLVSEADTAPLLSECDELISIVSVIVRKSQATVSTIS